MSNNMKTNSNRWTTELYQDLIGAWLRNESTAALCKRFHITETGLNKAILRLRKNGVPLPYRKNGHKAGRRNTPWTQEEVETVVRMRNERRATAEIASAIDRTFYGVQSLITKLRNEEDVPVVSLGTGPRRLWDADRLRASVAGRKLIVINGGME